MNLSFADMHVPLHPRKTLKLLLSTLCNIFSFIYKIWV